MALVLTKLTRLLIIPGLCIVAKQKRLDCGQVAGAVMMLME
jgi:hypothetical protein